MKDDERTYSALTHILNIIPGWGILFNALIWYNFKDRSRDVVFHAQQSILFQIGILIVALVGLVIRGLSSLVGMVIPPIGMISNVMNNLIFYLIGLVYFLVCLYGAFSVYNKGTFLYPFIGKIFHPSASQND